MTVTGEPQPVMMKEPLPKELLPFEYVNVTLKLPLEPKGVTLAGLNAQFVGPAVLVMEMVAPTELANVTAIVCGPLFP